MGDILLVSIALSVFKADTILEKNRLEAANRELSQRGISCGMRLQLKDGGMIAVPF